MSEGRPAGDPADHRRPDYVADPANPLSSERQRAAREREEGDAPTDSMERPSRTNMAPLLRGGIIVLLALAGLLLLILLLGNLGLVRLGWLGARPAPTRELILGEPTPAAAVLGAGAAANQSSATIPSPGPPPGPPPPVSPQFEGFYYGRGGERVLGRPLAAAEPVNGRMVQWFERARVEHWPEHAGTAYELQLGRLGVEYTEGRGFINQGYFVSSDGLRYFPETGFAVGGAFLRFYDRYGGLDNFGYPISEEFDEVLPDGRAYRVQYFERARMEYHPEHAGSENEVQLGLLGTALYRNEARPSTIQPAPTPVPMP
jgi:hypothetical protein